MTNKPRLLFHSNSPFVGTGYGQQCSLLAPRLKDHYDVAISANYGVEGAPIGFQGIPVLPTIGDSRGDDTIREHAKMFFGDLRNGLVVTLMDVWGLFNPTWRQLNVASWTPVDHEPAPAPVVGFFADTGAVPIAMSRFGERLLSEAGLEPLYCPHGIDCTVYRPYPQSEARDATKMPQSAFIVGMVAANKGNPSRKCFAEAFQAFKALHDRHLEARLYIHSELTGKFGGVELPELMDAVGLDRSTVIFCDQYRVVHSPFSPATMAQIYSSLDVLLSPSAGEGFGLCVLEANACGVPAIVSDFSAQPEVLSAGWTVSGRRVYTPLKAFQFLPDVEDIVEALESSFRVSKAGRAEVAEKACAGAMEYHVDTVLEKYMLPALRAAGERFEERVPVDVVARARTKHHHKRRAAA